MPLLALAPDGSHFKAWMMSSPDWERIKADYRNLGLVANCCGTPVVPVTSPTGWYFFRHKTSGCWSGESAEHLIAKTVMARAASALGLAVSTEARLRGGAAVADVLVRHPSWTVALEVQLSRVPTARIEDRQERYEAAGVRGAWLVGYDPPGFRARPDLPLFRLRRGEDGRGVPHVVIADADGERRTLALADFTTMLLTRRIRFSGAATGAGAPAVASVASECWKCRRDIDLLVALFDVPVHAVFAPRGILPARDLPKLPALLAAYRSALPQLLAGAPALTTVRPPPAGKEAGGARGHCPWCDAPISLLKVPGDGVDARRWERRWLLSGKPWVPAGPPSGRWVCTDPDGRTG